MCIENFVNANKYMYIDAYYYMTFYLIYTYINCVLGNAIIANNYLLPNVVCKFIAQEMKKMSVAGLLKRSKRPKSSRIGS